MTSERYIGRLKCDGAIKDNVIPHLIDDATFNKVQERRAHKCDTRRLLKGDVENIVTLLILDFLKERKVINEVADRIYRAQRQDSTELSRLKGQLANVQTQIGNFDKAIGMGIITETTKSTLLRLECEKSDLEKRIQ